MATPVSPALVVYGATGVTGALVCHELSRRGVPFIAAARNHQKLRALVAELARAYGAEVPWRVASPNMPSTLDAMLEGAKLLISCAGPFTDCGPPVARAALRKRVHYIDTTGEQGYIKWLYDELDQLAASRNLAMVPACAYEYAVGDLGCAIAAAQGHHHLLVCYASKQAQVSQGTKKSMVRVAAEPGFSFVRGQLELKHPGYRTYEVSFPDERRRAAFWFPGGESLSVPRHSPGVLTVETCMPVSASLAPLLPKLAPALPKLATMLTGIADKLIEQADAAPNVNAAQAPFHVLVSDADTGRRFLSISGLDPYLASARISVEVALRLLEQAPKVVGVTSVAGLFEPTLFLKSVDLKLSLG